MTLLMPKLCTIYFSPAARVPGAGITDHRDLMIDCDNRAPAHCNVALISSIIPLRVINGRNLEAWRRRNRTCP